MRTPRVNTTIMMDWRTLIACLDLADWRWRLVRSELAPVRAGLVFAVPVVVEELEQRRPITWMSKQGTTG